jgi:hypothetical protein
MTRHGESSCSIELVVGACALALVLGYRLEGAQPVSGAETGAWLALLWAITQGARTWVAERRAAK